MTATVQFPALSAWIEQMLAVRGLRTMGHGQRREDNNLGLGWLYYALGRVVRPARAVVIGSYRGFVPLVLARALAENTERGEVHFIDPSLADDFWKDAAAVREHFAEFGAVNIVHHLATTQQFAASEEYQRLGEVGLVFIDGFHSAEQAQFDFETFVPKLSERGLMLLHDSVWQLPSRIYGPEREYVLNVNDFVSELKHQPEWQVLDFPFGDGVTLVRRAITPEPPRRRRATGEHAGPGAN